MKLKYYLRGLGVGIIISTIILTIAFSVKSSYISDEEIIERASKLGMVMQDEIKSEEISEDDSQVNQDDKTKTDDEKDEPIEANTEYQKPSERKNESKEVEKTDDNSADEAVINENKDVVNYIPFTIKAGQSSNDVAANLQKAGLVDDAESFNKYLNSTGVDGLIQAGTFYVSDQSTYDDLAAILVTKQDKRKTTPPKNE